MHEETLARLDDLETWPAGWNGYGVAAPDPRAVEAAKGWVRSVPGDHWRTPDAAAADEEGSPSFEWWAATGRKVTAYLEPEAVWVIKVWGADIEREMEDLEVGGPDEWREVWRWLEGG